MAFRELVSPSLTELFVKEIEGMILSGELLPRQKLPPERELAAKMKVSLAVINGGITRLASKGFLRVIPRKGVFVTDYIREGNIQTLEAILEYSENYFQADLLDAMVDIRKACEGQTVERACMNRTDEHLEELERILAVFDKTADFTEKSELAFAFHHTLSISSGNPVYPLIYATFKRIYCSSYYTMFTLQGTKPSQKQFQSLLISIRNRNAQKAVNDLMESIEHWHHTIHAYYSEGQMYHKNGK